MNPQDGDHPNSRRSGHARETAVPAAMRGGGTPAEPEEPRATAALLHELRVHQVELETQNEALRANQLELEQARDRYLDLFDFAPVGYVTLTRQATIADANLTASTLFGIGRRQLRNRRFAHLVLAEDRDAWHRYFAALVRSHDGLDVELRLTPPGGGGLTARIEGLALGSGGPREAVRLTIKDVSERKRLEAMLAQQKAAAEERAQALGEAERFARATIDALPYRLCVIDELGRIVATNRMWRESVDGSAGGIMRPVACEACLAAPCEMPCWQADMAAGVRLQIDELLAGRQQNFSIDYECRTDVGRTDVGARWFTMRVSRFPCEGPVRLVVLHEEITERKRAEQAEQESAARLKRLGLHLETLREEQGAMIARELHDELGATLTMVKLGLATMADELARTDATRTRFSEILNGVDSALQVVKRVSSSLRPATLDTLGLVATIRSHAAQFSRTTGIATVLHLPDFIRLSRVGATTVFRIVQEGLTNVARHAGAKRVTIRARTCMAADGQGVLIVRLRDDGSGIAEGERSRQDAFGLIGMQERAQHLGGALAIRARPGQGTVLTLRIPLDDRAGGQ